MISIIIPIYNTKKYLPCLFKSLLKQTYRELEILLIDDGSTDGSGDLCKEMCKKDARFQYFYQDNQGPGAARNLGLEKAHGDFISFIDSDDYVSKYYYEFAMQATRKYRGRYIYMSQRENTSADAKTVKPSKINNMRLNRIDKETVPVVVMRLIFNAKIIKDHNIRFKNVIHLEDGMFITEYFHHLSPSHFCRFNGVYYKNIREDSICRNKSLNSKTDLPNNRMYQALPVLRDFFIRSIREHWSKKCTDRTYEMLKTTYDKIYHYDEGISICITAYRAKEYIKETLDSIKSQTWFKKHNNYEIIIGVDHDEELLDYLLDIKDEYTNLHIYMMNKNCGTYVSSNTIMDKAQYNRMLRFDADDIMKPHLVETLMNTKGEMIRFHCDIYDENIINVVRHNWLAWGQQLVSKFTLYVTGGYMPWVCGADAELGKRTEWMNMMVISDENLFKKRELANSLVNAKETNMKSAIRAQYIKYTKEQSIKHLHINTTLQECEKII